MPLDRRDVVAALAKKGFVLEPGRDHDVYFFVANGRRTAIYTKVSRGTNHKTIGDPLVGKIRRQLKLTMSQLLDLVNCPLDRAGYESVLRGQGLLRD